MSWPRYCFPTFVNLWCWFRAKFTPTGQVFCLAALGCLPAMLEVGSPLVSLFACLAGLIGCAWVVGWVFRPQARVTAQFPTSARCGEELPLTLGITNLGKWPVFDVEPRVLSETKQWRGAAAESVLAALGPGETASLPARLVPARRGVHAWPTLELTSTFPLRFVRISKAVKIPGEVVVFPALPPLELLELALCPADADTDERLDETFVRGGSHYLGNRDYLPGMYVKRWDYASWARMGKPVAREFADASPSSATIVIDTFVSPDADGQATTFLEAAISLVAGLANRLHAHGRSLFSLTDGRGTITGDNGGNLALEVIDHWLARLQGGSRDCLPRFLEQLDSLPIETEIHLVLCRWDSTRAELCRQLSHREIPWQGYFLARDEDRGDLPLPVGLRRLAIRDFSPESAR